MYLSAPFNLQNFYKKNFRADLELRGCVLFLGQKQPISLKKIFLSINHFYYFHLPMALFIVQNLKEILQWIQNYDDSPFLGPKLN